MTGRWGGALLCVVALLGACDEQRPEALIRVINKSTTNTVVEIRACRGHCDSCPKQCATHDGGPDGAPGDAGGTTPDLDAATIPDSGLPPECPLAERVEVAPNYPKTVAVFARDATGRDRFYLRYRCPCVTGEYGNLNINLTGLPRPVRFDLTLGCNGPPKCTSGDNSVNYCQ